ncbi:MAG TPA: hypothetical protein DCZ95_02230 [Verrucomicrobia bacterium]|nr:MAG: hypothetical protein A2X46_00615 [Lentisphaerae bacterium GWF2_57_35]HBA82889.1 hypothetical protein [Verrucomicrobiota bacterium]
MKPEDNLSKLLKQWRGIQPAADFEAKVWARIRAAEEVPSFFRQQILAAAASIILALGIGLGAGILRGGQAVEDVRLGTISGDYAKLVQGGAR